MLFKQTLLKFVNQPEEKLLFAKVLDQADFSLQRNIPVVTDFIDSDKCGRFLQILQAHWKEWSIDSFGGYEGAERRVIGFAPEYEKEIDYPIAAVKAETNQKFGRAMSHRDFMGSLLSLGIDRCKIGDIVVLDGAAICFVRKELEEYIVSNWKKAGSTPLKTFSISMDALPKLQKDVEEITVITPSLRLDAIVSAVFHLSRGKAKEAVVAGLVSINWSIQEKPTQLIKEGDMLALKGKGRVRFRQIKNTTRSGNLAVSCDRYS